MKLDKRLLGQAGKANTYLGLALGFAIAAGLLVVFQAHFLSRIIDEVFLKAGAVEAVAGLLAVLLVVMVARAGLGWISEVTANRAAGRAKTRLRLGLMNHLLKLGPAYTQGERSGELANTAVEGVEAVDNYFSQYIPQIFMTMLVPLIVLVVVFTADPLSGVVLLVTAPILPFFMILIGKKAQAMNERQWKVLSLMSAHFLDVLQGLTTLKLFGRSKFQEESIEKVTTRWREITLKVLRVAFLSALVMELGATLSTAIIAVEIGLRLLYGQIAFQPTLFVLLLAPEFYLPFRTMGARFHGNMSATAASKRIFEILDKEVSPRRHGDTENLKFKVQGSRFKVRFENVEYAYDGGQRPALRGVSFEIRAGEKVALVGSSGAGKSTVAQLLLRFMEPDSGHIYLDYDDGETVALDEVRAQSWREIVGWVPQNPYLFNTTIAENIRLGHPNATQEEVVKAAQQAHAHDFVMALPQGYDTVIGERGARLSGGQAQRLSLARAFLKDAPLLILDEATSNLDPENEALVLDAAEKLMEGRTVLLIAHRAATISRADRVIRLEAGQVEGQALEKLAIGGIEG